MKGFRKGNIAGVSWQIATIGLLINYKYLVKPITTKHYYTLLLPKKYIGDTFDKLYIRSGSIIFIQLNLFSISHVLQSLIRLYAFRVLWSEEEEKQTKGQKLLLIIIIMCKESDIYLIIIIDPNLTSVVD